MRKSRKPHCDLRKAVEAAKESERNIEELRAMSMEERGRRLAAACRLSAAIERSKIEMGLPPSEPAPWPASTWEFLKKHAAHARLP
jgi:hypothetical protein